MYELVKHDEELYCLLGKGGNCVCHIHRILMIKSPTFAFFVGLLFDGAHYGNVAVLDDIVKNVRNDIIENILSNKLNV